MTKTAEADRGFVDWFELTIDRVKDMPKGWKYCRLNSHNQPEDFIEVQGAITNGVYRSGSRKGHPRWPDQLQTIWIRFAEVKETQRLWESEHGVCCECKGCGEGTYGASIHGPYPKETCRKCEGTGKPALVG